MKRTSALTSREAGPTASGAGEQSKIYPLNGKATAKPMTFPDASGVPANMLPVSDGSAFDQLKQLVDSEGANLAESDSLGMLAAIGIIKGQLFDPDAKTRAAYTSTLVSTTSTTALPCPPPPPRWNVGRWSGEGQRNAIEEVRRILLLHDAGAQ